MSALVIVSVITVLLTSCGGALTVPLGYRAMNAQTPADHADVAAAYRERADQFRAESAAHLALAERLASQPGGHTPGTTVYEAAGHCRRLAALLSVSAREADALAGSHAALGASP